MPLNLGTRIRAQIVYTEPTGDNPREWDMNLEFTSDVPFADEGSATTLADACANFARRLLMAPFRVSRVILDDANYEGPYDPTKVFIRAVNLEGIRESFSAAGPTGDTILPLTTVLNVRKEVPYGYPGRMQLRGFLTESDIISSSSVGTVRLSNTAALEVEVNGAYTQFATAVAASNVQFAMFSDSTEDGTPRAVEALTVAKAGTRQLKNKVKNRYPLGLFGDILRAVDSVKDSLPALEAIADVLSTLEFLAPILVGAAARRRR